MVYDAVLTALCVLGLCLVLWWTVGRLLRPLPGGRARAVIPGRGEGENLEQAVRSFLWLRSLGLLTCPIVIADTGLSHEGRELALRLAARWPEVVLWPADRLGEYIKEV